ncbi:MAG: YciI family protein [Pseudomonadota bacterium]
MKFIVLFEDAPDADPSIRSRFMKDHLEFLRANANAVKAAGPFKHSDGAGAGGLWLVEAKNKAAVSNLVEEDPFWPTGLRQKVTILAWEQVFADGVSLI